MTHRESPPMPLPLIRPPPDGDDNPSNYIEKKLYRSELNLNTNMDVNTTTDAPTTDPPPLPPIPPPRILGRKSSVEEKKKLFENLSRAESNGHCHAHEPPPARKIHMPEMMATNNKFEAYTTSAPKSLTLTGTGSGSSAFKTHTNPPPPPAPSTATTNLIEQRKKVLTKLRGLIIPNVNIDTNHIIDLPQIISREMPAEATTNHVQVHHPQAPPPPIPRMKEMPPPIPNQTSTYQIQNIPPPLRPRPPETRPRTQNPIILQPPPAFMQLAQESESEVDTDADFDLRADTDVDADTGAAFSSSQSQDESAPDSPTAASAAAAAADAAAAEEWRILKGTSIEAINRKNVLTSSKCSSGEDIKKEIEKEYYNTTSRSTGNHGNGKPHAQRSSALDEIFEMEAKMAYINEICDALPSSGSGYITTNGTPTTSISSVGYVKPKPIVMEAFHTGSIRREYPPVTTSSSSYDVVDSKPAPPAPSAFEFRKPDLNSRSVLSPSPDVNYRCAIVDTTPKPIPAPSNGDYRIEEGIGSSGEYMVDDEPIPAPKFEKLELEPKQQHLTRSTSDSDDLMTPSSGIFEFDIAPASSGRRDSNETVIEIKLPATTMTKVYESRSEPTSTISTPVRSINHHNNSIRNESIESKLLQHKISTGPTTSTPKSSKTIIPRTRNDFKSLAMKWQSIENDNTNANTHTSPVNKNESTKLPGYSSAKRSVSVNDIRRAFENQEPEKSSPAAHAHFRVSSHDSTTSEDSMTTNIELQNINGNGRDPYGSITSLASSTSLISAQELQQLIDDANQSLEEAGTPSHEVAVVILHREFTGGSLGITLAGGADYETKEITVHKVLTGSIADRDGRIHRGDRVLSITGKSTKGLTHREALNLLKAPRTEVVLVVSRGQSPSNGFETIDETTNAIDRAVEPLLNGNLSSNLLGDEDYSWGPLKTVILVKDGAGLGFSLEGGIGSISGDLPLTVKKIFVGGPAEKCGELKVGDLITSINSTSMALKSRTEAWNYMKKLSDGDVRITIRSPVL